ncbi:MAG TPA: hypothetical protein VHZ03_14630 [Trebonia sp.]|jgi:hypothetical protein|nr:hypothetical protein [Trebonia sp.]
MADISMSDSELLAVPVSVPLAVAARPFGLGRNKAYELARAGEFPCPVIRVGERYRVNRAALYEALAFDPVEAAKRLAAAGSSSSAA